MENLQANLTLIQQRLAAASDGKYPVPKLIAVTKTHPAEDILPLQNLGVTDIGENKVQEIMEKLPALEKNFRIHLIGRLQSNKVKYIIDHVCLIHSVDRLSLAQEIDRQAQKHNRVMPVLIQVSPCGEAQKGGLPPEELTPFLRTVSQLPGLSVQGLMAVMPNTPDTALLDKLFADMRTLFERARAEAIPGIEMKELSMGMSHDYELEQSNLKAMAEVLREEIKQQEKQKTNVKAFISAVKKYTDMQQLDAAMLREFIDRIEVSHTDKKSKTREITIVYNFIGAFDFERAKEKAQNTTEKQQRTA